MKRSGFTMIELIFVIVIIGILSAVALPKFLGVATQAKVAKVKSYVGTLNMTVGPTLWSTSLSNGSNGSIKGLSANLQSQLVAPKPITNSSVKLNQCGPFDVNGTGAITSVSTATQTELIGQQIVDFTLGDKYSIGCHDGNATTAPHFWLYDTTTSKVITQ